MSDERKTPSFSDRTAMWEGLDFPARDGVYPRTTQFVDALRKRLGKVLIHSFALPVHPVLAWYLQRNQLHECNFFERFWLAPTPAKTIPYAPLPLNYYDKTIFEPTTTFHLTGVLSAVLFTGGAYSDYKGYGLEAQRLGEAAAAELITGDYEETLCYVSYKAWSDFFYDVAWDFTLMVASKSQQLVHVILATDTD